MNTQKEERMAKNYIYVVSKRKKVIKGSREEVTGKIKREIGLCTVKLERRTSGKGNKTLCEIISKAQDEQGNSKSLFDVQLGRH